MLALVAASVGTRMTFTGRKWVSARAKSCPLPPPTPTTVSKPCACTCSASMRTFSRVIGSWAMSRKLKLISLRSASMRSAIGT